MSSGWWKTDVVEGGGGNWGSLDRVFDKSLVAKSRYLSFEESHRTFEEWRAGDYEPMSYGQFKESRLRVGHRSG